MDLSHLSQLVKIRIEEIRNRYCRLEQDEYVLPGVRAHVKKVNPIAQVGPQCGLVALCMASSILELPTPSVSDVFHIGKSIGITKLGEVFSAYYLKQLIHEVYPSAICDVITFPSASFIAQSIIDNAIILLPYDCDKNHEPANRKGHYAHWCIVTGFLSTTFVDDEIEAVDTVPEDLTEKNCVLFAYHGKSRHLGVWTLSAIRESNAQLFEIGNERTDDDYAIPPDGIDGLRNKAVIIRKGTAQPLNNKI